MNVSAILNYEKDPAEDFYAILGCDPSSTSEQVLAEFKARARGIHPDKCAEEEAERQQEKFKYDSTHVQPDTLYIHWDFEDIFVMLIE